MNKAIAECLETMFGGNKKKIADLESALAKLRDENRRLRKALEFYANSSNWSSGLTLGEEEDATRTERRQSGSERDKGLIAMRALKSD